MIKKILSGIAFCLLTGSLCTAQDLHYSQFMSSPVLLNPASTGLFNGILRVALNGKNQWQSVSKSYQSLSLAADFSPVKRRFRRDAFGLGLVVNADIAGDSKFSTTSPALTFSYIKSLNRNGSHLLSAGVQAGWVFRTINYDALSFPSQYNGYSYDPNLPVNEVFELRNYNYFDLALGAQWNYQLSRERQLFAGLSAWHLLKPRQSFMGDESIKLDLKWNIYAGAQININEQIDALPQLLFMKQGIYRELLIGSQFKFINNRYSKTEYTSLSAGIYYRNRDALILTTGFDYRHFAFGLSYDINVSGLKPASRYRGGLECSLVYIYGRYKTRKAHQVPCPIF